MASFKAKNLAASESKLASALKSENAAKRKAALEEAIRRKIELDKCALNIVESLLEEDITEEFFLECGKYITPSHYKDTVDERFIIRLCGYPLCQNKLKNVPKQKYKISSKTNKVYDITERKCFCSDFCYRASKYFEAQIPKNPVWLRDDERAPNFKLLKEGQSGQSGLEVKLLERPLIPSDIENPDLDASQSESSGSESDSDSHDAHDQEFVSALVPGKQASVTDLNKKLHGITISNRRPAEKVHVGAKGKHHNVTIGTESKFKEQTVTATEHKDKECKVPEGTETKETEQKLLKGTEPQVREQNVPEGTEPNDLEKRVPEGTEPKYIVQKGPKATEPTNLEKMVPKGTEPEYIVQKGPEGTETNDLEKMVPEGTEPKDIEQNLPKHTVPKDIDETVVKDTEPIDKKLKVQKPKDANDFEEKVLKLTEQLKACNLCAPDLGSASIFEKEPVVVVSGNQSTRQAKNVHTSEDLCAGSRVTSRGVSKRGAERLRKLLDKSKQSLTSDRPVLVDSVAIKLTMLEMLMQTLMEWKTEETLTFLYGSNNTEVENNELDEDDLDLDPADLDYPEESLHRECQNSLNESLPFKEVDTAGKPLPSYEKLQEETALLDLRVREFFKGKYTLPEEVNQVESEERNQLGENVDAKEGEPFLPFIDSLSQHNIRKRIVLEKLKKVLHVILVPLDITYGDICIQLNNLVKTFRYILPYCSCHGFQMQSDSFFGRQIKLLVSGCLSITILWDESPGPLCPYAELAIRSNITSFMVL
ncbi:putative RNA polymerase II subunit B1 CTD phosphatase RPAP2 isoform X2 [Ambystoma mexicanum]|uniref:putative RNA polymerase II subunit B1 CTD phosphatase RPAP2 isoform X2 n=1 Tax=Ambystoma mexicanum TaxID=8296 RepID=UPI0037E8E48E